MINDANIFQVIVKSHYKTFLRALFMLKHIMIAKLIKETQVSAHSPRPYHTVRTPYLQISRLLTEASFEIWTFFSPQLNNKSVSLVVHALVSGQRLGSP
jgi:hypothetical protein